MVNELYLLEYLGHSVHLTEIALYITRLNYDIYISPKIKVVAFKNINSALKVFFMNFHIYFHTLDYFCAISIIQSPREISEHYENMPI